MSIEGSRRKEKNAELLALYRRLAPIYKQYCDEIGVNEVLSQEVSILEKYNPRSVLEFGVGDGRFAHAVLERLPNIKYVGVDVSKDMLALVKDPRIQLVESDFEDYLDASDEKFDMCVAPFTVWPHIETAHQHELLDKMLLRCATVLIDVLTKEREDSYWPPDSNKFLFEVKGTNMKTPLYRTDPSLWESCSSAVLLDTRRELLVFGQS
jgi:SAM-dependent methyltransferase